MKRLLILLLFVITMYGQNGYSQVFDSKLKFYVSSNDPGHDAGIALFELDSVTGEVRFIKEFSNVAGSSYLTLSKDKQFLYTVGHRKNESGGTATSFLILDEGYGLEFINEKKSGGKNPCYASVNEEGNILMVANYSEGNVTSFQLNDDGFIGDEISNIYHVGSSVNRERQEMPHPHMIVQMPGSNLIFVPDLGIDKLMIYELSETGELSPGNTPFVKLAAGAGPRHVAFHPSGNLAFVLNELNATVTSIAIDQESGEVKIINTQSILPENFKGFNKSADILVAPNGKFIYATNRGHNSIALLELNESSGEITFVKTFDSGGDFPRAFRLSPDGKFLLVANKNSGNIVIFKIDSGNGDLTKISGSNQFPGPQCIRFFDK